MERRGTIRTAAATAAAFFGTAAAGLTYPIAPRTLWDLAAEAERVVLARVAEVSHRSGEDDFASSVARLHVLETWKGAATPSVAVAFMEGFVCPAPDRYVEGETVLAFLESGETRARAISDDGQRRTLAGRWSGQWFTVGLSYGTLYPDPEAVPTLRQLVAEALQLQSHRSVRDRDRRQWLVRAAAEPATRWHGLYGLSRDTDSMHSFYDRRPPPPDLAASLTLEERSTLASAFCKAPLLDHTVPMMLKILADHPDREVDLVAVAAVESALEEKTLPFWVQEAMPLVLGRFGEVAKGKRRERGEKDGGDCDFTDDPLFRSMESNDDEIRRAWGEARARLGLPFVARLPRPARRVRGVGDDTPP